MEVQNSLLKLYSSPRLTIKDRKYIPFGLNVQKHAARIGLVNLSRNGANLYLSFVRHTQIVENINIKRKLLKIMREM